MNIALTGGGTAGHIMPNMALLGEMNKRFDKIIYIGNKFKMEGSICKKYNVPLFHCESVKFDRSKKLVNLKIPFVLPKYVKNAKKILKDNSIDVVFSKGGYVGLPVTLAAKSLKIPVIVHESDASLGVANKIASKFAKAVITSFDGVSDKPNVVCIGNPIREQLFLASPEKVFATHNIDRSKPIVLIVGGSLGSSAINQAVYLALDTLCAKYTIIHICGDTMETINHADYIQLNFVDNIEDYISVASLVVSRCGAGLSSEITALNKRVIYIPLPCDSSRGDQLANAKRLAEQGYAKVLLQQSLSPLTLSSAIDEIINMPKKQYDYDRQIPAKIVKLVYDIADKALKSHKA